LGWLRQARKRVAEEWRNRWMFAFVGGPGCMGAVGGNSRSGIGQMADDKPKI